MLVCLALAILSLHVPDVVVLEPSNFETLAECSTTVQLQLTKIQVHACLTSLGYYLTPCATCGCIWILKLLITSRLFYHCATAANQDPSACLLVYFWLISHSRFHLWLYLNPQILNHYRCSTTVQLQLTKFQVHAFLSSFGYYLTPDATCGCNWTLKLWITSRMFYHCATAANQDPSACLFN